MIYFYSLIDLGLLGDCAIVQLYEKFISKLLLSCKPLLMTANFCFFNFTPELKFEKKTLIL